MLLSLITIKFMEFVQMVREVMWVESYKAYAQELGEALKLEFAELNMVGTIREEMATMQMKLGLLKKGIKEEVTALAPLATKAVAAAKEFKDQLATKTSQTSEVVSTSLSKERVSI